MADWIIDKVTLTDRVKIMRARVHGCVHARLSFGKSVSLSLNYVSHSVCVSTYIYPSVYISVF